MGSSTHLRVVIDRAAKGQPGPRSSRFVPTAVPDSAVSADALRLYGPLGRTSGLPPVDPARLNPDPRLLDEFTPARALAEGVLPLRLLGQTLMVAVADPAVVPHLPRLTGHRGMFLPHLAPFALIEEKVLALRGAALATRAETTVPPQESCRGWSALRHAPLLALLIFCLGLTIAMAPDALLIGLVGTGMFWMLASTTLKLAVLFSVRRRAEPPPPPPATIADRTFADTGLPVISIIVALYREADIAHRLITRLGRIDYPRDRLDVILAVEDDDLTTRAALMATALPGWMRMVTVPQGALRTKPRALNHALTFARGTVIGIYDAEDAPAPQQLRDVVAHFAAAPPEVACLQGVLDFYNPRTNWLSRCFTVEYAAWFRVMLPGLQRLGLVLPLGGTTLFFRRAALEELGAWDAWNVTEDADLGLRLARHGLRTELVATVTEEEANCRLLPWIRQRSRWIKGYMLTWAVHMRDPLLLLRQLGLRRFVGVQVLFLGSICQSLLVPVMWTLWAAALGLTHPAMAILPTGTLVPLTILLLSMEGVSIAVNLYGMALRGKGVKLGWVLLAHFYFPLAAFAAYKALHEVITRPFYWDKTSHGHFDLG
ncbi:MAG: glycosyltransferase [Rhodobacteraceae bacterium]|nr:glycosyltransferase [Paracoccaceae bacterium]